MKVKKLLNPWIELTNRIARYTQAAIDESWKGGCDPNEVETLEMRFKLAKVELEACINRLRTLFGDDHQ